MDCDCNRPDCLQCFEQYAQAVTDAGYGDKELYYEWWDVKLVQRIEYEAEQNIPDEIYNLKDSW